MNIKEAIQFNEKAGKNAMPIEDTKQFWAETQDKSLTDKQIQEKTYSGIKLVESLVNRDKAGRFINSETMEIRFRTVNGEKTKKVVPYNLWIDLIANGEVVYSITYRDWKTSKTIVLDGQNNEVIAGKGWKDVRDYFRTEVEVETPKAEVKKAPKTKVATQKPEDTEKKIVKKAASKAKTAKTKMIKGTKGVLVNPPVEMLPEQEQTWVEPEIPEELQ